MRRRTKPQPAPVAPERARVRRLVVEAERVRSAGRSVARIPAMRELEELFGVMAFYALALEPDDVDIDELTDRLLGLARSWGAGSG